MTKNNISKKPRGAVSVYCIPKYSLFEILCSPKHKHSKKSQRPPGNSFILMTPYPTFSCSTTPEFTNALFYFKFII